MQTQAKNNMEIDAAAEAKRAEAGGFEEPILKRRKLDGNEEEKQNVVIQTHFKRS